MSGKGAGGGGMSRGESKRQLLQFPLALASFTDFQAFSVSSNDA